MSRIINTFKWIRKNPKKSIFFFSVGAYAVDYIREKYLINQLMRKYCMEAKEYGNVKVPTSATMKKVLVILNPAANKRKAEENFEKFCAPILHLAGFQVEIQKTQSDQHAIRMIEDELNEYPDAIVIAGGDGTISEAVTGLLRKAENDPKVPPVGVLPVGKTNQFSLMLFNADGIPTNKVDEVRSMATAALSVVKGKTEQKDIMKIQLISDHENTESEPKKPFYAVGSLIWGSFNDILRKKDRYWVTGSLRNYTAFLFNGFGRKDVQWDCKAKMIYSDPCAGCSNCYEKVESKTQRLHSTRWWSKFNATEKAPDYSKILNPDCLTTHEEVINSSEVVIATNTAEGIPDKDSKLNIKLNVKSDDYGFEYIWNSWKRVRDRRYLDIPQNKLLQARTLVLLPETVHDDSKEVYYSIDNEPYELMPIKITLLPKRLQFFTL
ncbi:CLUMA_CG009010, isoform A [Clunio marinus]|uniref:Acylglycerol kinase, mitochondrial n=1 Tax=Clunio marinus TaxID=568069 RepID=A0A1J1IAT1_9DIPT|nr:CLUMA_CG009010, isoform A [Clunio marinus]